MHEYEFDGHRTSEVSHGAIWLEVRKYCASYVRRSTIVELDMYPPRTASFIDELYPEWNWIWIYMDNRRTPSVYQKVLLTNGVPGYLWPELVQE